ncbi:MAG: hypothetical protein KGK33_08855 [Hyphomicrobiales bacterium]|nr:hypothetical protein [Hyphomicrobiales bacterium]
MARPTISQRIALEGGDQIKRALAELGKAGEDAFAQLQKAGEKVNLSAPAAAIEQASKRAGATVDELRQRLTGAGGAASQSSTGVAAFGTAVQATQQKLVAAVNAGARLGLAVQGVGAAFSGAFGKVHEFGTGVAGAFQSMGASVLKSTAVLAAVPAALIGIATSAANAAAQIKEASIAAGTSPQEYQKLAIAAEQLGGSEEKLVAALSVINERVQEQSQNFYGNQQRLQDLRETMLKGGLAGRQAAEDFRKLQSEMDLFGPSANRGGQAIIDVEKALKNLGGNNRDAIERLKGFADEISALPTPAERASRVIEIFGRRLGPQLVELLSGGRQAIEDIGKRAESLGLIMSNAEFSVAKNMNDALALLHRSIAATKNSIGLLFAPAIADAANLFTEAIGRNRTDLILWASDIAGKVRPVLLDLVRALTGDAAAIETGWIKSARQLIIDLGAAIADVTQTVIVPAFQALLALLQTVAEAINGIFGTQLTAADVGVILVLAKMTGAFTLLASVLRLVGGAFGILRDTFLTVMAAGRVLLVAFEALSGVLGIVRAGIAVLIAAFGAVPVAIAAIGFAIGFLGVQLIRAIDWSAFVERARAAFETIVAVALSVAQGIQSGLQALVQSVVALWNQIAAVARTAFAAVAVAAAALWSDLQSRWQAGVATIGAVWDSMATAAQAVLDRIVAAVTALWENLQALWQAGIDAIGASWETIVAGAQGAWAAILAGVTGAWGTITSLWGAGIEQLISYLARLRDFALGVWNAIAAVARAAFGAEQQAAGAGTGFARGGPVFGAGTATSDSVPAFLSNGEFVIRAAAVRKYGLSLFNALNRMRLDPSAFQRFAEGGLVRSLQVLMPPPIHFADGGLVPQPFASPSRILNLTIGNETFAGLAADEDTMERLTRFAVRAQLRSSGRKPGWTR